VAPGYGYGIVAMAALGYGGATIVADKCGDSRQPQTCCQNLMLYSLQAANQKQVRFWRRYVGQWQSRTFFETRCGFNLFY